MHARRERGALLGVVLILLAIILAASAFALWNLRTDTGSTGNDRFSRQLFDCAEQGLQFGKQYFSTTASNAWNSLLATNVCASLPCPPFPANAPGPAAPGYPDGLPYTDTVQVKLGNGQQLSLERKIGLINNPETTYSPFLDHDQMVFVYSRCRDLASNQSRAVQALIKLNLTNSPCGYGGQAGGDCHNSGNMNH